MPLHTHSATADVIVHELSQPHRFTHVANCKCGFHGSCYSEPEAIEAAKSHLQVKHRITNGDATEAIHIAKFKTGGGMGYDQLLPLLRKEEEPEVEEAKEAKPPSIATQVSALTGKPAAHPPTLMKPTMAPVTK